MEYMPSTQHTNSISVKRFIAAFYLACNSIIKKEDRINQINVFPVSDKDTGTNLTLTLIDINDRVLPSSNFQSFLIDVAHSVFDNARGNSGVIFSIFIDALSQHAPNQTHIPTEALIELFDKAYQHLCHEVHDIAQGTIISFMGECVDLFQSPPIIELFKRKQFDEILIQVKKLLHNTQEQNPILKQNGVIDAGAYALYLFLKTFIFALPNDHLLEKDHTSLGEIPSVLLNEHEISEYPQYRYCTEGKLVLNDKTDQAQIKTLIETAGDSDLFLKRGKILRFHVHANDPVKLSTDLLHHTIIKNPKIDDLYRQYQMIHHRKHDTAIVTDSSADLPSKLYDSYAIFQIPLTIQIGENELLDRLNINPDLLYKMLPTLQDYPKTAAPTLGTISSLLKFLKKYYKHIIILTISSKLSSTYKAIRTLTQHDTNIHVFDTKKNSGSHGYLVRYAAEMLEKQYSVNDILKKLALAREATNTFVIINSVDALIRSGRIGALKGWIARFVNVKPILTLDHDGKGVIIGKKFTKKSATKKLLTLISNQHQEAPIHSYSILHTDAEEKAHLLSEQLTESLQQAPDYIQSVSPALGIHVGIGAVAVSIFQTAL